MEGVFLHLGAHKTATSYFQATLRSSPRLFEQHNCRLVTREDIPDSLWRRVLHWQRELDSLDSLPEYLDFLNDLRPSGDHRSTLLTFEGLIGRVSLALDGSVYPSSEKSIAVLHQAFNGHPVRVGFSLRNYADFLVSTYSELVNGAFTTQTFDEYLAKIDLEELSWNRVVGQLRAAFGTANVMVWSYESYCREPTSFNRRIVEFFLGAGSGDLLADLGDLRVRSSTGASALELQRRINVEVRSVVKPKRQWRQTLQAINVDVREAFADLDDAPLQLPADLRRQLDERYRRDCLALGIDLPSSLHAEDAGTAILPSPT